MDYENINVWYWLIPIVVGVICGIIGYSMGKGNVDAIDNSAELQALHDKNSKLQSDLDVCNKKLIAKPSGSGNVSSSLAAAPTTKAMLTAFDAAAAKTAFGKTIIQDDLKVVEGIGPKIAEMFHGAGITTWKALSETSVASCQDIVNSGGDRYKVHESASWPMQAKMCYEGKWKELFRWQDEHRHGKL
ncbi:Predicted 5' DNA nuclease, flap endonuclease-1-like, helix-3-turn-helix (H3TH) domain [Pricia antarctica]|uniref:Predicted 5' DNA nuclease, flap endonuclease-1-like, helix-3-turn-helix (H3TH) domain n=1 Tax=Pricia antarctica TaxID=641691 RepID=A0A1G6WQZ4_9FLAO|nr:hypothetical protein [Pricia antarctica]SDD68292.1 Predicted 5' DNA nuclease, flap endonuclease-1-like, helix-3-turn-helix (H3TH) domain [Pricia antarctica]